MGNVDIDQKSLQVSSNRELPCSATKMVALDVIKESSPSLGC